MDMLNISTANFRKLKSCKSCKFHTLDFLSHMGRGPQEKSLNEIRYSILLFSFVAKTAWINSWIRFWFYFPCISSLTHAPPCFENKSSIFAAPVFIKYFMNKNLNITVCLHSEENEHFSEISYRIHHWRY